MVFPNLKDVWADSELCACRYSHSAEVQVRLQFLTCVFSTLGSPDHFSKNHFSIKLISLSLNCTVAFQHHSHSHFATVLSHFAIFSCWELLLLNFGIFFALGLSLEQVDILWHCLVEDAECYDDALHWFLNQVRSKDQHAMGMETYKHLFLEKVKTGMNYEQIDFFFVK